MADLSILRESGKLYLSHPRRMRRESLVWFGSDGMAPPNQETSDRDDWERPRDSVSFREDPYDLEEFASSNLRRRSVDDEITSFDRCKQCDEFLPIRLNLSLGTPAHLETLASNLKLQVVPTRPHRKSHRNGTGYYLSLIENSKRRITTTSPDSNFAEDRSENTNTVALNDNLPALKDDLPSASLPEFEESRLQKRRNKRRKHKKFNEALIDALYEEARKNEDAIKMLYGIKAPPNVLNGKKSSRKIKQKHPIRESCGGQEVFKRDIPPTKISMSMLLDGKSFLVPEIDGSPMDLSTPFNDEEDDESVTVKVYESAVKISNNSLFSNLRFVPRKKNPWFKRVDRHNFDLKDPLQALSVDSDSEGIERSENLPYDSRKYSYKNSSKNHESRLKYEKLPQRLAQNEYFAGVRMTKSNNGSDVSDINNTIAWSSKIPSREANIRELDTNSSSMTAMKATNPFREVKKARGNSAKIHELEKNTTDQGKTLLCIRVSNGEIESADFLKWNLSSKASEFGKLTSEKMKMELEEGKVKTTTEDKDFPVNSSRKLLGESSVLKAGMNQTEISKSKAETLVGLGSKMSTLVMVTEKAAGYRYTDSEFVTGSTVLSEIKTAKSNVTISTAAVMNKAKNVSVFPNFARNKNKPVLLHVNYSLSNVASNHFSTKTNTSRSISSSSNASLLPNPPKKITVPNRSLRFTRDSNQMKMVFVDEDSGSDIVSELSRKQKSDTLDIAEKNVAIDRCGDESPLLSATEETTEHMNSRLRDQMSKLFEVTLSGEKFHASHSSVDEKFTCAPSDDMSTSDMEIGLRTIPLRLVFAEKSEKLMKKFPLRERTLGRTLSNFETLDGSVVSKMMRRRSLKNISSEDFVVSTINRTKSHESFQNTKTVKNSDLNDASVSSDGANRQLPKVKREDADISYKTILHATGEINIRPINSTFNRSFKSLASKSEKPFTFGRNSENMNFDDHFEQVFNQDHETHDSQDKITSKSTHTSDNNEFNRFRIDSKQKKNNHSLSTPSKIVDSKDAQAISSELRRMIVEKSKREGLQSSSLQNEHVFAFHPLEKSFEGNRTTSLFDTVVKNVDISSTTGSVRPGEEASDVDMKLEGIISGKLPNQMVNSIFAKVNGNGKLVSDLGLGQVSLSSYDSLEDLTVPNNQREGEVKKQAERMMMSITRELTRLIQETSRKQGCYTLKPEMLNFLRWLVAPAPIKRDEESENLG